MCVYQKKEKKIFKLVWPLTEIPQRDETCLLAFLPSPASSVSPTTYREHVWFYSFRFCSVLFFINCYLSHKIAYWLVLPGIPVWLCECDGV